MTGNARDPLGGEQRLPEGGASRIPETTAEGGAELEATGELSAAARASLIAGMSPEDAQRVPELHEVEPIPEGLRAEIESARGRYPETRSAVIPALWAVQRHYGWCAPEGMRIIGAMLGETPAYVESVASFYDLFRLKPAGEHRVLVCTNISCWMNGADGLLDAFCEAAGCDPHEASHGGSVSADGGLMVSGFECLGACDIAPMASIDERYFGPLEVADAGTAVEQLRQGAEVLPDKRLARRGAAGGTEPEPDERIATMEGRLR